MSTHRSMRGAILDMDRIRAENEFETAVGNANMNARGDLLGPGGKIIKTREELMKEYYNSNPKAVKKVNLGQEGKARETEKFLSPQELMKQLNSRKPDTNTTLPNQQFTNPINQPNFVPNNPSNISNSFIAPEVQTSKQSIMMSPQQDSNHFEESEIVEVIEEVVPPSNPVRKRKIVDKS